MKIEADLSFPRHVTRSVLQSSVGGPLDSDVTLAVLPTVGVGQKLPTVGVVMYADDIVLW